MIQAASQMVKVPLTSKIRILADRNCSVQYAQMLERAGCKVSFYGDNFFLISISA